MKRREPLDQHSAQQVVLDQQLALSAYLQALLSPEPEVVTPEAPAAAAVETTAATAPLIVPVSAPVIAPAVTELVTPGSIPVPAAAPQPAADPSASPYPDWAATEFQCLLFRVAGLTLALPLAKLNGVLPWDESEVTQMPGHKDWFLGVRSYLGQQVRLIDVAKVIMPQAVADAEREFGKVILIGSGRWGLVCDDIAEVVNLAPAAVKWRLHRGNRPWLAGTVIERMCALIDADRFAQMLATDGPPAS